MTKPYAVMRPAKVEQDLPGHPPSWRCEYILQDTPNESLVRERLLILTHISAPLSDHSPTLILAALLHVHELLGRQIEAMKSP